MLITTNIVFSNFGETTTRDRLYLPRLNDKFELFESFSILALVNLLHAVRLKRVPFQSKSIVFNNNTIYDFAFCFVFFVFGKTIHRFTTKIFQTKPVRNVQYYLLYILV